MKRPRSQSSRPKKRGASIEPLEVGQRVRDARNRQEGVVLEFACQYAHPKADPVYSYLIRWEDGQVNAVSEAAFEGSHGIELID